MSKLRVLGQNVVLVVIFIALAGVIMKPLFAALQYDAAQRLVLGYQWIKAEDSFRKSIEIDASDSRYLATLGEFLLTQSGYKDNKIPLLKKAEVYYTRAAQLNPRCADYFAKMGQIYLSIFLEEQGAGEKGQDKEYIEKAFDSFKKAVGNDPNGFNVAYTAGYAGLSVWKYLNEGEREIVINRLKYALAQKPRYSKYIYPRLLQETGSARLLELITPKTEVKEWIDLEKIENLKKFTAYKVTSSVIPRLAWQGTAVGGNNVYKDGNMYWGGTIYGVVRLPKGDAVIKVTARGSPVSGVYPYMLVSLDGRRIGGAYVGRSKFKAYPFTVNTDGGIKVLGVTFTNDEGNTKEDRNLFIGSAWIEQK